MATTLATFLDRVARDLHETTSDDPLGRFSSGLFSDTEVVAYASYVEKDFLRQTGIIKTDTTVAVADNSTLVFTKSAMDIERLSFNKKRLYRVTSWDLELENPNWRSQSAGPPRYWHEDRLAANTFEFDRLPVAGGSYRMFADYLPPEHTLDFNETISVPDVFEPYVRFGVLALCFGKSGDNQDLARASYCEQRYAFGCMLAKNLILGRSVAGGA